MGEYKIVDASELDYEAYATLQKKAFADLLVETGSADDFMTPEYYRWKYNPPVGKALIALRINDGKMVASTAMYPLQIRKGSKTIIGWQCCDVSTLVEARGRGHFYRCAKILEGRLEADQCFFGFPNDNARPTWEKIGWTEVAMVTTWVKPLSIFSTWNRSRVESIDRFDSRLDALSRTAATDEFTQIDRSSDYLNWRYAENKSVNYQMFVYRPDDSSLNSEIQGYAIARNATALNRPVTIVMDILGLTHKTENFLFNAIAGWANETKHPMVVMLDNQLPLIRGVSNGFIPVWSKLLPKKQLLMGKATDHQRARDIMHSQWHVKMGDWDAF